MKLLHCLFSLSIYFTCVSAQIVARQVQLGPDEYFVPPEASWSIKPWTIPTASLTDELLPLTVIRVNGTVDVSSVRAILETYNKTDDVWTPRFAQRIYLHSSSGVVSSSTAQTVSDQLRPEYEVVTVYTPTGDERTHSLPGPYFVHAYTGQVYRAYKLYPDSSRAFLQSSYQDSRGHHHPLRAATFADGTLTVAVPSRLYYEKTKDKPLAGVRIGVKDLFDLKGLKTSFGNKHAYEMSNFKMETAPVIQKLIDAGAIIVGKNKLSQFAAGGDGVTENLDYLLATNPRGDGQNSPSDSSSGSGSSVASYNWLDASIGSDTGGSIRGPAFANGLYGGRPTYGAVNLTGAGIMSSSMDTAGPLTRSPPLLAEINRVLFSHSLSEYNHKFPASIFLDESSFESLLEADDDYAKALNLFLDALKKKLSANVSHISISKLWNSTTHDGIQDVTLSNLLGQLYGDIYNYEQWNEYAKNFVNSYRLKHNGDFPHVAYRVLEGWLLANSTMNQTSHQQNLKKKAIVEKWAAESFLSHNDTTCSNAIFISANKPQPDYKVDVTTRSYSNPYVAKLKEDRDTEYRGKLLLEEKLACNTTLGSQDECKAAQEKTKAPVIIDEVYPGRLASLASLPDYVLTLGSFTLPVPSDATLQKQMLPGGVKIMAAKGCDFMILDLVEDLYKTNVLGEVLAGGIAIRQSPI